MLNLLPRKEFEITLEDSTVIKGQFGTWALKRFCDKKGYSLKEAGEHLGNPSMGDIVEFLLSAVEYSARKTASPFSFTDVHCCEWIDQMGGMQSETFTKLFNHASDQQLIESDEKKTEMS